MSTGFCLGTRSKQKHFFEKYNFKCNLSFLGDQFYTKVTDDIDIEVNKYPLISNLRIDLNVKISENWYVFASLDNILLQSKLCVPHTYDAPIMISLGAWYVV